MRRAAAVLAMLLGACGTLPPPRSALAGTEWRVTAIDGRATPNGPVAYSMTFEALRLGARFGCNVIGGTYRASAATVTTDALIMTEMACGEPASSFESQGSAILQQPMTISRSGGQMSLANSVGTIELVRAR